MRDGGWGVTAPVIPLRDTVVMATIVDFGRFKATRAGRQLSLLEDHQLVTASPFGAGKHLSGRELAHRARMLAHLRSAERRAANADCASKA
jgi:hypothetical protein